MIAIPDPEKSGACKDFLAGMVTGMDNGEAIMQSWADNGLTVPGANKAALEAVKAIDLPEIFIVSNVSTDEAAPAEGAVVEAGVSYPGLTVAVSEAKGTKCPRCWMHSETPDEHGLCPRCAAVCKALNVVFE